MPADTHEAARRLLALAPPQPLPPDIDACGRPSAVASATRVLAELGDLRDRIAFERLCLDTELGVNDLARALDIGYESVRRSRQRAESRARELAESDPTLMAVVERLTDSMGVAAQSAMVDQTLADLGMPPSADTRSALCLWLAGPYRPIETGAANGTWLALAGDEIAATTRRLIDRDGGVQTLDSLWNELAHLGVAEAQIDAWLASFDVRIEADTVVSLRGAPATVAERILSATGAAMTAAELVAWAAAPAERAGQWQSMLQRDRRFVEVAAGRYELAEWGSAPVGPASIGTAAIGSGTACDGLAASGSLRVAVDEQLLAGAAGEVPHELLEHLGIRAGATRCYATRYGPLALSSTADGARRGSLRPVALAAGASPGDVLVVRIDAGGTTATVELVAAERAT